MEGQDSLPRRRARSPHAGLQVQRVGAEGYPAADGSRTERRAEAERGAGAKSDSRWVSTRGRTQAEELCSAGWPDRARAEIDGRYPERLVPAGAEVPRRAHLGREGLRRAERDYREGLRALLVGGLARGRREDPGRDQSDDPRHTARTAGR